MIQNNRLLILIVDDNPMNLKLLETTLSKDGYQVVLADNGPDARKIAVDEKPDLILLDIKMPGEDGFKVIKNLKENSITSAIPVIFLTGVSDIHTKLYGFELGAVDFITKPFHPREVLARVSLHLKLSIATNSLIAAQAQKLKQITEAQTSMLTTPEMQPKAKFGVCFLALHEAGGDFYEVLPISEDIFGYFVGDFSGHDIKTSYLTLSVKALLKQNSALVYQAHESMKMINDVLMEILPEGRYLTACYARLNRKTYQMTIVNAGNPPVIFVPSDGKAIEIEMEGDLLGIFKEIYFGQYNIEVKSGDRFYFYSDGLIESFQKTKIRPIGSDELIAACEEARYTPVQEAPGNIVNMLLKNHSEIKDDIVLMTVEV